MLFSDVLLTLSLDWLALSPASAPEDEGSFLFFLAKNFLNVWNLDFFFPERTNEGNDKIWFKLLCSPASTILNHYNSTVIY